MVRRNKDMQILYTSPSGWDYYAWDKEGKIKSKPIHHHAIDFGLIGNIINNDLLHSGDDVESTREFLHVIAKMAEVYGFDHIVDPDAGFDNPEPIAKIANKFLDWGWKDSPRIDELMRDLPEIIYSKEK